MSEPDALTPSPVPVPEDTATDRIASIALWAAGLAWMLPMMGTMMATSLVVPPSRTDWLSRLYCRGQILLTGNRWHAVVHPGVDPKASYLFAQNHTNHFDHVVLYNATPHFKQGVELADHFRYPVYGWFMRSRGTIPIERGRTGQTERVMAMMRKEVAAGHSILAFPEGTRTTTGRVGAFRSGMFFVARDLGIPVVPVSVVGMYRVMRKGSLILRPGNDITVYVDEPIPTAGLRDDQIPELAARTRAVIADRVDRYWQEHGART